MTSIAWQELLSKTGVAVVMLGLIGETGALVIASVADRVKPRNPWKFRLNRYQRLVGFLHLHEKGLSIFFTMVVISGVVIEQRADRALSALVVNQQEPTETLQRQTLKMQSEAADRFNRLNLQAGDRFLDPIKALAFLKGKPKGTAQLLYKPNDREAYMFALQIEGILTAAGWTVPPMKLIPSEGGDPHFSANVPPEIRYGDSTNLAIKASLFSASAPGSGALGALTKALGLGREGVSNIIPTATDPTLPKDHFLIVVEEK